MLQTTDMSEKEAFFYFMNGLKPQVKYELKRRGVQELSKAMIVANSLMELVLRKDQFEFFQLKEKGNSEEDEEGKVECNDNGGNGKHGMGKEIPTTQKRKRVRYNASYVTIRIW